MTHLSLRLLGTCEAALDGQPITLRLAKAQALLAYLAVESDRAHSRDTLAGLLWPDYAESSALTSLRSALAACAAPCTIRTRSLSSSWWRGTPSVSTPFSWTSESGLGGVIRCWGKATGVGSGFSANHQRTRCRGAACAARPARSNLSPFALSRACATLDHTRLPGA